MTMTTTTTGSSSSGETITTKQLQLNRLGSGSSSSGCCSTCRTTTTAGSSGTSSSASCVTPTPTPTSSCSSNNRSNKSVILIPNSQFNPHQNHHHHHHHHNHSSHHHLHNQPPLQKNPQAMTERWFLCSSTARTEARLLALLDVVTSVVYLIMFVLLTYAVFEHPELVQRYLDEVPDNQDVARLLTYGGAKKAFFLAVLIFRPSTSLLIAILLFTAAQKRNYSMCRICFAISVIYIVVDMILFIPKTIYTQNGKIYVITYLFNVVYMLYELWVTYQLKNEVAEWHEKHGDSEGEPETEDTTVVDAESENNGGNNQTIIINK